MIHLRLRTEYSFRRAFGRIDAVLAAAEGPSLAITDSGTWGHTAFYKACSKAGRKALLGVELLVVEDVLRQKPDQKAGKTVLEKQGGARMAFLARNQDGLEELYQLVSTANQKPNFYYEPRLDYSHVNAVSPNLYVLSGHGARVKLLKMRPNVYLEYNPANPAWNREISKLKGWQTVVCCDNVYPTVEDRPAYEVLVGVGPRGNMSSARTSPQHILTEDELRLAIPEAPDDAYLNTERIAADCECKPLQAAMVKYPNPRPLYDMCLEGAPARHFKTKKVKGRTILADPVYQARLEMELDLIQKKNFEDYFYVITDLVQEAKRHMLVGPARGSSAGSLACFLLGITDVDPIVHNLMFERFIDITRADLPDIDIDFQDDKRDLVKVYLTERYGKARVGQLGTINTYKPKSALGDVGKMMGIPAWELKDLKGAIIDRSSGDARAQFCIADTFETLDIGKTMIQKYPGLMLAGKIEGHAQHCGTHAAGVIITNEPLTKYAALDIGGCCQIDKKSAEVLNILKIDALGLRTLAVLQDTLDQIGKDRQWLIDYPLDDTAAFEVFNQERYTGVFQYEGYALQMLTRQMKIHSFDDIAVITALARPGPLHCGAAVEYIERRTGKSPVTYLHPAMEPLTRDTYGTVIYQEQVMMVCREIGQLSWEDVQTIRRAMSKSLGDEFFGAYWEKFKVGAVAQGISDSDARRIWDGICTFGSWAFNKSHAVSYGLISYWCAMLKARYPLQFAAACLRSAKDDEQAVKLLRELAEEGIGFTAVDPQRSGLTWSVVDGKLVGGLTNIKGIGEKTAQQIILRRKTGAPQTPSIAAKLANPVTPYDDIFEGKRRFAKIYADPKAYKIRSGKVTLVRDISEPGEYVFIAKIQEKNPRDMNEEHTKAKRGGRIITKNNMFLNLVLVDDTGLIFGTIRRFDYKKLGVPIVEKAKVGDWYLWKGVVKKGWTRVDITQHRRLEEAFPK